MAEYIATRLLSNREVQILQLVAGGGSNKAIGTALGISEDTVKSHVKSIFVKIGVKDRTHAVIIAMQR